MTTEWLVRFLLGGFVISLFASAGDILRPKSFAGVFAAAPALALATLTVTISGQGWHYAATEARLASMSACHIPSRANMWPGIWTAWGAEAAISP